MVNRYGNHTCTPHKPGGGAGGANRGQGNITNEERKRRELQKKRELTQKLAALDARNARDKANARANQQRITREYENYCKLVSRIYECQELERGQPRTGAESSNDNDEEDDDDDDYNDNDDEEDNGNMSSTNDSNNRSSEYMPEKDSCIWGLMEEHETKMKSEFKRRSSTLWLVGDRSDPVATNSKSPETWYKSRFQVFNWLVFDAFGVDIASIKCIHGCQGANGKTQNVKKHGSYCWTPIICIDRKIWLYHQRLICNCCKRTFTTTHPNFLSQLPTRVVERLEFYVPRRGPGIHQSLVFQFISLVGTGVMFGSYVNSINEMSKIKYAQETVSYFDSIGDAFSLDLSREDGGMTFAPKVSKPCNPK